MQTVSAAFTAEEHDTNRSITQSVQIAWKKSFNSAISFFTIGVSTIGGTDIIPAPDSSPSNWNKYQFTDESTYVTSLAYDRELQQPIGGLTAGLAEIDVDNTSGRYTPRQMGGVGSNSEIFTAVNKPARPFTISAGFNMGADINVAQFVGLTDRPPAIDMREKKAKFQGTDWVGYLQDKYVDNAAMFTYQTTDQIIKTSLTTLGFSTAQYDLDTGINVVPFAEIEPGDKWGDFINKLVQAEDGIFYQDETGKLRFQNRQAWDASPYNTVQRIITTAQVIEQANPNYDHIINVVEIKSKPRAKQVNQLVFTLSGTKELPALTDTEIFVTFEDPMLAIQDPVYIANTKSDGTGTDVSTSISLKSYSKFIRAAKIVLRNNTSATAFITSMTIYGRPAKVSTEIYTRYQDDSSVTAYSEKRFELENEYIGSQDWANSYAQMILNDYAEPENLQEITIRAIPEIQFGDLVSWQGRYWRIFGIATKLDSGVGFIQTLKLLQRTPTSYFRIGISTIGSSDKIAP